MTACPEVAVPVSVSAWLGWTAPVSSVSLPEMPGIVITPVAVASPIWRPPDALVSWTWKLSVGVVAWPDPLLTCTWICALVWPWGIVTEPSAIGV